MARTKYAEHFCAYCNKDTRMEIVGSMEGKEGKAWFRCTRCHLTSLLEMDQESSKNKIKLDPAAAKIYDPILCFSVGESIFHNEWNDVGKVVGKMKTSDGSQAIVVSFEKLGSRRLIENLKPEATIIENQEMEQQV